MSTIVVLGFKDEQSAEAFKSTIDDLADDGALTLEDAVMVVVAEDGTLDYRHFRSVSRGGAVIGGLLGGVVGLFVLNPVAGAAVGAAGGAALGKLTGDYGIEEDFIAQTAAALKPGATALFLQVAGAEHGMIDDLVEGRDITVITTRLGKETREAWLKLHEMEVEEQRAAEAEQAE